MAITVTVAHDEADTLAKIRVTLYATEAGEAVETPTDLEYGEQRQFVVSPAQSIGVEELPHDV